MRQWILDNNIISSKDLDKIEDDAKKFVLESKLSAKRESLNETTNNINKLNSLFVNDIKLNNSDIQKILNDLNSVKEPNKRDLFTSTNAILRELMLEKNPKVTIIESLRQQTNRLKLIFQLPSLQSKYSRKPSSYIASLLGHESEGSVLEELKRLGFATNISCGCSHDGFSRSSIVFLFEVSVQLTEKGLFEY